MNTSISQARELLKESFLSKYCRQTFVNFVKTGENLHVVDVNSLQNDRPFLLRERVRSAMQLKRGDHIERPLNTVKNKFEFCHHMLVLQPLDDSHCEVIHVTKKKPNNSDGFIRRERVNIFENETVSRVKYCERIDPDEGIALLLLVKYKLL